MELNTKVIRKHKSVNYIDEWNKRNERNEGERNEREMEIT